MSTTPTLQEMTRPGTQYLVQHWSAPNDTNGNARRLWAVMDPTSGDLLGVIDEGLAWSRPGPAFARVACTMIELPEMTITATEYRDLKKRGELLPER